MYGRHTKIYVFRTSSNNEDYYQQPSSGQYKKLFLIIAIIAGLFLLDFLLTNPSLLLTKIIKTILFVPIILISLTFHEFAHAWMADFLGDFTPRHQGRLSLNPMRHLDLWGTLALLLFNFGWAKPVPVDSSNFRKPDRAMVSVSLAGPLSNIFLAVLAGLILRIIWIAYPEYSAQNFLARIHTSFIGITLLYMLLINLNLAFFNLIPIPPLDGSKILFYFLSPKQRISYRAIEPMAPLLLLFAISLGLVGMLLGPIVSLGKNIILGFFFGI